MDADLTSMVRQLRGLEPDKWQRGLSILMHGAAGKLEEQQAEIERLRGQLVVAHAETLEWIAKYNECETFDERDAEIERLRSQLAAMECGYKSFRDTAEEEFARLRSLIRARLAGPRVDHGAPHANVLAWDRVWLEKAKEMVGDE